LTQAGLSPIDSIKAATKNAAELLGAEQRLGTIEKGKLADIVIADGTPSSNISDIGRIDTVIKNGRIIDLAELTSKISKV
jgi:imidazolonepropionase-like amidohydrolase